MSRARRKAAYRARRQERLNKVRPMFIDARELAVNGIVKEVPESYDFGVMCLPNRPETEEDWADIREFALMIHETEQDAGPF